ncbi:hypothetical protein IC575_005248 [Cucumis melo]|uniref:Uncharacterized protein LOC103485414 isoform X2 n=2 Tax=Cucumis melo TaxID=3656 RepID=A0A1S3B2X7_CUCME|nr:uncharacterized protein LOC103485414 isoform X2 [Cucumis melo]
MVSFRNFVFSSSLFLIGSRTKMVEASAKIGVNFPPFLNSSSRTFLPSRTALTSKLKPNTWRTKSLKLTAFVPSSRLTSAAFNQTDDGKFQPRIEADNPRKGRVFFLDVNPLCYQGNKPSLRNFGRWVSIFFEEVSHSDPVIAVFDGEGGSEHRRLLLPSYKAHRIKFTRPPSSQRFTKGNFRTSYQVIRDALRSCNVPVVKVDGHEADDVVATLVEQVLQRRVRVVVASPDKDFKQLISEDVQLVMPLPELNRWSFYTIRHYLAQYNCDPCSDLSLRCIMGDEVDGVPGIQHVAPGFGRKTALKLLKKHGSLENLLSAAAIRTVGKPYAQDALTKYAEYLRTNYKVLALRRDVDVQFQDEWLVERDRRNDSTILSKFVENNDRNLLVQPSKQV